MDNLIFDNIKKHMEKSLESLRHELAKLRTGRASLAILDDLCAEYYGTMTPLKQMATLSLLDARTIAIQPWDTSAAKAIEKAVQISGLGLNPVNDGKVIRITIPALNEERRRELVKVMKKHAEECKVAMRNLRRDGNEEIKNLKKVSKITEDDERKGLERIQKFTDDYMKAIDEAILHKEKDIMEV